MSLPTNISFCKITGTFMRAVADASDPNRDPEGIPLTDLRITFTANLNPPLVRNVSAGPPVTIVIDPVVVTTDETGALGDSEGAGIYLVASDDPDLQPSGWTYAVDIRDTGGATLSRFSMVAPSGGTVDLTTVIPVPANPGEALPAWLEAVETTEANAAAAAASAAEAAASVASFDPLNQPVYNAQKIGVNTPAPVERMEVAGAATGENPGILVRALPGTNNTQARVHLESINNTGVAIRHTVAGAGEAIRFDMNTAVGSPGGAHVAFRFGGTEFLRVMSNRMVFYGSTGQVLQLGTGDPNGSVAAPLGSIYLRTSGGAGTTLYVKESGAATNTGWVGK